MVEKIETLLLLLGMIGVLAVVAERLKFPFPILLVIAGLAIGVSPQLPEIKLNPDLVFLIFLPPLLFSAAWNFPWDDFRANLLPIFGLAVGLVLATMTCVAFAAMWLIPGMTLAAGIVLGAIVCSFPPFLTKSAALRRFGNLPSSAQPFLLLSSPCVFFGSFPWRGSNALSSVTPSPKWIF